MAEDHTWQEYANQDNVDDAYQDLQEGVFEDQDRANEEQAKYDRVASEILRRDGNAESWPGPSTTSAGCRWSCRSCNTTRRGVW